MRVDGSRAIQAVLLGRPDEMKTLSLFDQKAKVVIGSAFLTLALVGAISYRGMAVSIESNRWVRHTHVVLEKIQDLRLAWESIAYDSHEFTLTGKDSSFESYRADALRAERDQETIGQLTVVKGGVKPDQCGGVKVGQ